MKNIMKKISLILLVLFALFGFVWLALLVVDRVKSPGTNSIVSLSLKPTVSQGAEQKYSDQYVAELEEALFQVNEGKVREYGDNNLIDITACTETEQTAIFKATDNYTTIYVKYYNHDDTVSHMLVVDPMDYSRKTCKIDIAANLNEMITSLTKKSISFCEISQFGTLNSDSSLILDCGQYGSYDSRIKDSFSVAKVITIMKPYDAAAVRIDQLSKDDSSASIEGILFHVYTLESDDCQTGVDSDLTECKRIQSVAQKYAKEGKRGYWMYDYRTGKIRRIGQ
jgi:hypothetical protein